MYGMLNFKNVSKVERQSGWAQIIIETQFIIDLNLNWIWANNLFSVSLNFLMWLRLLVLILFMQ